jgi:hypothetical protein
MCTISGQSGQSRKTAKGADEPLDVEAVEDAELLPPAAGRVIAASCIFATLLNWPFGYCARYAL